ncbi:hypothetical protein MMC28_003521 [Mycoblastus sanguinarius]|nr:hypothetical protein [Mycoblastus sanguinarius]
MAVPEVSDDQALHFLASEGYLPLALSDQVGMVKAYSNLFLKSSQFFNLPEDSLQKTAVEAISGPAASEEGYSKIPGEKSILTVRTSSRCPETLQEQLKTAWNLTGKFMEGVIEGVAGSLDLQPDVFSPLVSPCITLPEAKRTPTLLRMFRYDRPRGAEPTVNAERHKDLGLLSLVVGHSPGLQVLDTASSRWVPIEEDYVLPAGASTRSGGLTATLLSGETLAFLSRGQYKAGIHRVMCAPSENEPYRFSIVFTLRPAVAPVYTRQFESSIVGSFAPEEQADGESSTVLFERIRKSHWNVNAAPEVREKQREEQRKKYEVVEGRMVSDVGAPREVQKSGCSNYVLKDTRE